VDLEGCIYLFIFLAAIACILYAGFVEYLKVAALFKYVFGG